MNTPPESEYYVLVEGQERGPYTLNQLCSMWGDGRLTAQTRYCTPGMTEWRPLSAIIELLEPKAEPAPRANRPSFIAPVPQPSAPRQPGTMLVKPAKSRGIYIILALFFGLIGVHNFYAGHYKNGAAQLIVLLLLGWLVIGILVNAIWVLVELFTVKVDGNGDPMT